MDEKYNDFVKDCCSIVASKEKPTKLYNKFADFSLKSTETQIKAFNLIRKKNINDFRRLNLENVNIEDEGNSLLFQAIFYAKLDIVKYLVEKGADLSIRDKYGRNAVQYALLYNDKTEIAKYLMTKPEFKLSNSLSELLLNANVVNTTGTNEQDETGSTIWHYVCAIGSYQLIEKLDIKKDFSGIQFDLKDNEGFTCIDRAAANGHVDMLKLLQQIINFNLDYDDEIGKSILFKTLKYSPNGNVLKWWFMKIQCLTVDQKLKILFEVNGRTPDAISNKLAVLSVNGIDYRNIRDENGNSFIMKLAESILGPIDLNKAKLTDTDSNGSELINVKNKLEQTALHIAAQHSNLEFTDLASILGLDMSSRDVYDYSCFEYGVKHGYIDILRAIPQGLNDRDLLRLFNIAIINQRNEIFVKLLDTFRIFKMPKFKVKLKDINTNQTHASRLLEIAKNAENDLDDENGFILNIIKNCKLENLIKLKSSFLDYTDDENATILHILALFERNDVILWLISEKGFDFRVTDKNGNTALNYAAEHKDLKTILLLLMFGLNYSNVNETKSSDFNEMKPFIDKSGLMIENLSICKIFAYLSQETFDNLSTNLKQQIAVFRENKPKIEKIYDRFSNDEYLVKLSNEKHFVIGILCMKAKSVNEVLELLVDNSVIKIDIDIKNRKETKIICLSCNRYFLILIDKISNKDHALKIYYFNKNEKKYILVDSVQVDKWYYEVRKVELINENAWIVLYNKTKAISVYRYIFSNNEVNKTTIFENKALKTLGLKYTLDYQNTIYLFSRDKRYLILYKPQLYHIYYIDLNNTLKPPFVVPIESEICDVKCIGDRNLIVKTPTSVRYLSVTQDGENLKLENQKNIFNTQTDDFIIRLIHDILIAVFNKHIDIYKLNGIDTSSEFAKHSFDLTRSDLESEFFVTEDKNYLLYSTETSIFETNTQKILNVINLTSMEKSEEIKNMIFDEFYNHDSCSTIMISDGIPHMFCNKRFL